MNPLLEKLGFHDEIQALFPVDKLRFSYGGPTEIFTEKAHFVPVSEGLWIGGAAFPMQVIISCSVMEIMAYLNIHRRAYPRLAELAFVATGLLPGRRQFSGITERFPGSRFVLVFPGDVTGAAADIRISGWLTGNQFAMSWQKKKIIVRLHQRSAAFEPDALSLHRVQQAFGLRSGVRTKKSNAVSFLKQLLYDYQ